MLCVLLASRNNELLINECRGKDSFSERSLCTAPWRPAVCCAAQYVYVRMEVVRFECLFVLTRLRPALIWAGPAWPAPEPFFSPASALRAAGCYLRCPRGSGPASGAPRPRGSGPLPAAKHTHVNYSSGRRAPCKQFAPERGQFQRKHEN